MRNTTVLYRFDVCESTLRSGTIRRQTHSHLIAAPTTLRTQIIAIYRQPQCVRNTAHSLRKAWLRCSWRKPDPSTNTDVDVSCLVVSTSGWWRLSQFAAAI